MSGGIAKKDPFGSLSSLRMEIDRLFDAFFGKTFSENPRELLPYPPVLVEERASEFLVHVELPGVQKEDIHLSVTEDSLIVSGEKRMQETGPDTTFHQIEISYGRFERSIPLPSEVLPERTKATFRDGVLTVRIPKSEKGRSGSVDVDIQ
jgi:HSP20 family protein